MALYLISYDVKDKDKFEYPKLYKQLEEMSAVRILDSEWAIVRTIGQAKSIYDKVAQWMKADDRLLVQELTKDAQWDKLLITDQEYEELCKKARD